MRPETEVVAVDMVRAYCQDKTRVLLKHAGVFGVDVAAIYTDAWFEQFRASVGLVQIKSPQFQQAIQAEVDRRVADRDWTTRQLHAGPWNALGLTRMPTGPPYRCWEAA